MMQSHFHTIHSSLLAVADGAASPASVVMEKLSLIHPEVTLFIATCVVMMLGLSKRVEIRRLCAPVSFAALVLAGVLALSTAPVLGTPFPGLMAYAKVLIAAIGALLVLMLVGTVDRGVEGGVRQGRVVDPLRSNRGEFYAFFLFSLTGLMLCATADDLIWLFLALELTSLPTYVMVAISSSRGRAQEAGIKYFFLGAFGAATFLMGFALLYGATGTTELFGPDGIQGALAASSLDGEMGAIAILGIVMSVLGVAFKIAAVPMHFYTADVYEGAAAPVSAFLAFVPKTAGFISLILLCSAVGWSFGPMGDALPEALHVTLWVMAALTMTVGNVLAMLQKSVKRMLAYSSIAHSGYMLVGLVAGSEAGGLSAIMFYLFAYGFMNLGAFAVVASLERGGSESEPGRELDTFEDLKGLTKSHPLLGWTMTLCGLSMLGLPMTVGFFGKFFLFTAAVSAGEIVLVAILAINSAIAAFYYLKLSFFPLIEESGEEARELREVAIPSRRLVAVLSAASVIVLVPVSGTVMELSTEAMDAEAQPLSEVSPATSGELELSLATASTSLHD